MTLGRLLCYAPDDNDAFDARLREATIHPDLINISPHAYARCPDVGAHLVLYNATAAALTLFLLRLRGLGIKCAQDHPLVVPVGTTTPAHLRQNPFVGERMHVGGSETTIAIADPSGVAHNQQVFGSRLTTYDATGPSVTSPHPPPSFDHGTSVASAAAGASPCRGPAVNAMVWSILTKTTCDLVLALQFLVKKRKEAPTPPSPMVLVVSFAVSPKPGSDPQINLADALRAASDSGIILCAAGGNLGAVDSVAQPALDDTVVAVGGYEDAGAQIGPDQEDLVDKRSSRGPAEKRKPDILVPYEGWPVLLANGSTDTQSGTSFGAGHVAGLIATWLEVNKSLGGQDIFTLLQSTGVCIKLLVGGINEQGLGALVPAVAFTAASTL